MRVEGLANYLQSEGIGTIGVNIFAYHLHVVGSVVADPSILILPNLNTNSITPTMPNWRCHDKFQIIVRSTDVFAALKMSDAINSILLTTYDFVIPACDTLPAFNVKSIYSTTDPMVYPRDDSATWEVSMNYDISYVIAE